MKISRTSAALGAIAAVLVTGAGLPALGQDAPESLLPPGFDEPVAPQPSPTPAPTRAPGAGAAAPAVSVPGAVPSPTPTPSATPTPSPTPLTPEELAEYELPDYARRGTARVGAIPAAEGHVRTDAFAGTDGRFLEALMRRTDAPVASRWLSIALRRAMLAATDTPPRVDGADFAAERAWLLLRMGEAIAARDVIQAVDVEDYTPKLFQVALQVQLATADPAGLCPLIEPAKLAGMEDRAWQLAEAFCAGLAGEPNRAGPLIDAARRQRVATGIDFLLAEKVLGAGAQGRRSVTIEWDGVDQLTAWRYGLAVATGVEIPDRLFGTVRPWVRAWRATAPMIAPWQRVADAEYAASRGVLSSAALVDLYAAVEGADEAESAMVAVARDLRTAYTAPEIGDRLAAMRGLWDEPGLAWPYARQILTARAAANIPPTELVGNDVARLIGSMLSAGFDIQAARWRALAGTSTNAWAMIVLSDPYARGAVSSGDVNAYRGVDERKAAMLFAGLAGLGRLEPDDIQSLAQANGVRIGLENAWTRAISRAAEEGQQGTVLVLAAVGMQTPGWAGVPPEVLFHSVAALRAVGLEGEARMIAAEAIGRL